jgi:hypothetical protein
MRELAGMEVIWIKIKGVTEVQRIFTNKGLYYLYCHQMKYDDRFKENEKGGECDFLGQMTNILADMVSVGKMRCT